MTYMRGFHGYFIHLPSAIESASGAGRFRLPAAVPRRFAEFILEYGFLLRLFRRIYYSFSRFS